MRNKQTRIKDEPIITCRPWNPVATKNEDPYTLSAIVNEASLYSMAWIPVKIIPYVKVKIIANIVFLLLLLMISWCAHVIETPLARRSAVLRRGIANGLIGSIPVGGQMQPIWGVAAKLLWKKAQKKERKNITSEEMNKAIPHRNPFWTTWVWTPSKVASRIISFHQRKRIINITNKIRLRVVNLNGL